MGTADLCLVGSEGPETGGATARGMCTLAGTRARMGRTRLSGVTGQICRVGRGLCVPWGQSLVVAWSCRWAQ